jgi:hypothetical protein
MRSEPPSTLLSVEFLLYLVGGSMVVVGLIVAAKTGAAFISSPAVALIAGGATLAALGHVAGLLARIAENLDRQTDSIIRSLLAAAGGQPSRDNAAAKAVRKTYKDHEIVVHQTGEIDARLGSEWRRFASLDELDTYISSQRYDYSPSGR